jgi:hypothetical protein
MEIWLIVAIIVGLILLRIVFKVAKFVIVIGLLVVVAIVLWNTFAAGTP